DLDRFADTVQADLVAGGQRLNAADARDDLVVERQTAPADDLLDDPEGAVVERRVAPDQERAALVLAKMLADGLLVALRALPTPVLHRGPVRRRRAIARRLVDLNRPIRPVLDVPVADLRSQPDQISFLVALVDHEEHVDAVEGLD